MSDIIAQAQSELENIRSVLSSRVRPASTVDLGA